NGNRRPLSASARRLEILSPKFLPLYPEERRNCRPTAEQVFRLFSLTQRHVLKYEGQPPRTFEAELTPLQRQVLGLLGVPEHAYRATQ
ncbi:MAG: hypothetical protein ACK2UU_02060, partial [Anaerolineae bacterium]